MRSRRRLPSAPFGFGIQPAVDAAVRRGSGDVVIPAGEHETGTVKLGSNVRVVVRRDSLMWDRTTRVLRPMTAIGTAL